MINNSNKHSMQTISTIIYGIWLARNSMIHHKKNIPAAEAIERATTNLSDYRHHLAANRLKHSKQATTIDRNELSWSPPPSNYQKLNVDAHLRNDGRWGFGLILRNEDGRCLGAATRVCAGSNDVAMAEATGLSEAIRFVTENHLNNIIIELDAAIIVQAVTHQKYPRSNWGNLVKSCVRSLGQLENVSVSWVRRDGNEPAHALARWAFPEPNHNWTTNPPSCILTLIQKDMGLIS
jgi:ribonuclease HI